MDLYKRAVKLPYLDNQYSNKWIENPGQFHTALCFLRCLGQIIENSGLDQALVEADLYSSVTVHQILNGKHYNRAIDCHITILQVLYDIWIEAFFKSYPEIEAAIPA